MKMKSLIKLSALALIAITVSCKKDDTLQYVENNELVPATILAESTDGGSKTIATYDETEKVYHITWEQDDALSVFNDKTTDMSKFTSERSGGSTKFYGEIPEGSEVTYAIFPYDKDASVSDTEVYTNVPTEQSGDFSNVVLAGWPKPEETKAPSSYDFKYQFEAVSGIVKFSFDPTRIAEGKTITSISLTADKPISGDAKIIYGEDKPVMTSNPNQTGSNVYNVVTIQKKDGFTKGDYYFAVFPINVADDVAGMNIVIRFETSDGNVAYTKASLKAVAEEQGKHIFAANIVKYIGSVKITEYQPVFTSGEFTVDNSGKKVTFSRGNLQYQASTNTWRFALNQWDAQGEIGNMTQPSDVDDGDRKNQSEWIDLFPWGHSGFTYNDKSFVPYHAYYRDDEGLYLRSQTGTLSGNYANGDWGKYCTIQNGDKTDTPGTWRLLSFTEFNYIAYTRTCTKIHYVQPENPNNHFDIYFRFLKCGINTDIRDDKGNPIIRYGVMVFPDKFTWPEKYAIPGVSWGASHIGNTSVKNVDAVVYSLSDFAIFETAGAVFLPSAGQWRHDENRITLTIANGTESTFNQSGCYWTTNKMESMVSYAQNVFQADGLGNNTNIGRSVRLVKDANVK